MLKIIAIFSSICLFSLQVEAYEDHPIAPSTPQYGTYSSGAYFKLSGGFSSLEEYKDSSGEIKFEDSAWLPINIGSGIYFPNMLLEGELGFSGNEYDYFGTPEFSGEIIALKLMMNAAYKFGSEFIYGYVGGGVGFVNVGLDGYDYDLSGSSLAIQFLAGVEYNQTGQVGLFAEYKNFRSVGLDLESETSELDFSYKESSVNVGVRIYY